MLAFGLLFLIASADSAVAAPAPDSTIVLPGRPLPCRFYSVVHDLKRDRVVLFGGRDSSGASNQVWTLSLTGDPAGWSKLEPAGPLPAPRSQHAALYDPDGDRMFVFGGFGAEDALADLWALSLGDSGRWEQLFPEGDPPKPRYSPSMVLDRRRHRALIVGGESEVWVLSLETTSRWGRLPVRGNGPGQRSGQTAVLDSTRDRILVFGGFGGNYSPLMKWTGQNPTRTHNDVWELTLGDSAEWTLLEPKTQLPPDRGFHAAGIDRGRDHMLILGGRTYYHGKVNDMWAFTTAGAPGWVGRAGATRADSSGAGSGLIVDDMRDRLLVFGGLDAPGGFEQIPLAPLQFQMPKPPSPWGPILLVEGFLAAYSCIGYIEDGEWLVGLNGLSAVFATGGAVLNSSPEVTREAQFTLGLGWLALTGVQADQVDRHAPNNEIVLGNFIGMHGVMLLTGGVEWVARKLHGPRH
jgi:hypothetical protein